ncbi:MAG: ABC transporter substrate-binding protein [Spirochaetes bacterium]|nr:ABC transporter substrate-binding protein [Spirochaetota bacterium]
MRKALASFVLCLALSGLAFADLMVGLMPALNSIPLVVAEEKGYFAAEGVRVSLSLFASQLYREAALQSNAIDGSVSDLINAIQGWSSGLGPLVTSATEGSFSLLASPQSELSDLSAVARLDGRKIETGLLEGSIVFYVSERILERAGIDPERLALVPIVQVPVRMEMLLAGKVEAACLPEPLATLAVARGARRLGDSDRLGETPGVLLFTRKALAEKQREISAFYRAYDRAVAEVNGNPGAFRAAIVERCELPPEVLDLMKIPRFRPAFLPSAEEVLDVARWMAGKGLIAALPRYQDIVSGAFAGSHARNP